MRRRELIQAAAVSMVPRVVRAQRIRLRIGVTAVILADQAAFLARWADYLARRIGCDVSFVARDQYQPILDLLLGGQLEAAWICGYPYVRHQARLKLLAVPLYVQQPLYSSYLIRPKGGPVSVRGWPDLKGKVFAYSDPLSNSGWLVTQGELVSAGVAPRNLKRSFFAHGHRNVAEAVAARLADAGSIDGYVWETMRLQRMPAALQTEVVWKSALHGFPPIVARIGSTRLEVDDLARTLLEMASDEHGRPMLAALNLDGFVAGEPSLFESIRRLASSIPGTGVTD